MDPDFDALTHHDALPDGTHALIRPLHPKDAALYPEFLAHVSPDDLRLRFFSVVKELSAERISDLTHVDYTRAMRSSRSTMRRAKCWVSCGCISTRTARAANTP